MKKNFFALVTGLALTGALWTTVGAQEPKDSPAGQKGGDIEARLRRIEAELATEQSAHAETRQLLEQTVAYLEARAKVSESLLGELTKSEELGFTAGINYQSREVLLSAFRSYWSGSKEGLPKVEKKAAAGQPVRGGRR